MNFNKEDNLNDESDKFYIDFEEKYIHSSPMLRALNTVNVKLLQNNISNFILLNSVVNSSTFIKMGYVNEGISTIKPTLIDNFNKLNMMWSKLYESIMAW